LRLENYCDADPLIFSHRPYITRDADPISFLYQYCGYAGIIVQLPAIHQHLENYSFHGPFNPEISDSTCYHPAKPDPAILLTHAILLMPSRNPIQAIA
jgi:hypothetical protein